ncbi:aldehyde dehydrogenase [Bacillus sp. AFS017336]|uniref:aldehyde dehydrogenase n=1 Tax=Bacillus sp. AFS017336 TaxID=2033489 RepID=UPI00211D6937|nr:aldehyde dehydrogenase [Bacillus sp. AFS017336]
MESTYRASEITQLVNKQKAYFQTGITKTSKYRITQLKKLYKSIVENEEEIKQALKQDLNKSDFEAYMTEIGFTLKEISEAIKKIEKWMKPKKVKTPITHFGTKGYIYREPYGVTLIISPWNYPFQLAMAPLIGAIIGGNTAVIKPSELTPNTSKIIRKIIKELFDEDYIAVVEGGISESTLLLQQKFDLIFFTGSVQVGKIVMEAASKNLTPLILELGGKSPTIVHSDANIQIAAKRIVWGKFTNAGQTCIAPDYIYVHDSVKQEFINALKNEIVHFYNDKPLLNNDYSKIISERHFNRLVDFLKNGQVVHGGDYDLLNHKIEPTLITDINWDSPIMSEEIFGPILPILSYFNVDEVLNEINQHPKPLALYVFTEDKSLAKRVIEKVPFGGGCVNDTLYHMANPNLPFGGVGESGTGNYHGEYSFSAFTHDKSVLLQTTKIDLKIRYHTTKNALRFIRKLLK